MNAIQLTKLAFSLSDELNTYQNASKGLAALPKTPQALFGPEATAFRHVQETVKNRHLGMPPVKPGIVPPRDWTMWHDPIKGDKMLNHLGAEVPHAGYVMPNTASLPAGPYTVGRAAHQVWRNQMGTRPTNLLATMGPDANPVLEHSLALANLSGPNTMMAAQAQKAGLPIQPMIGSWRRKYMKINPNFNQAFRQMRKPEAMMSLGLANKLRMFKGIHL